MLAHKRQELVASLLVFAERSQHSARNGAGMLFFDAAHHHAKMPGLANNAYTPWVYEFLKCFRQLLGQALLNLKTPCEHIHHAAESCSAR